MKRHRSMGLSNLTTNVVAHRNRITQKANVVHQ